MAKFAVSVTFHMIDVTDLDSTRLALVEAKTAKEAATKALIPDLLDLDKDAIAVEEIENGLKEEDFTLPMEHFLSKRGKYWMKNLKLKIKNSYGYDFICDRSNGVFGVQVLELNDSNPYADKHQPPDKCSTCGASRFSKSCCEDCAEAKGLEF